MKTSADKGNSIATPGGQKSNTLHRTISREVFPVQSLKASPIQVKPVALSANTKLLEQEAIDTGHQVSETFTNESAARQIISTPAISTIPFGQIQKQDNDTLDTPPKEEPKEIEVQAMEEDSPTTQPEDAGEPILDLSQGQPLDPIVRKKMEKIFGADFSLIRIHTSREAIQAAQKLQAKAFTKGNDIFFNKDKFNTTSKDGLALLAHELTHTIQQGASKKQKQNPNSQIIAQETASLNSKPPGKLYKGKESDEHKSKTPDQKEDIVPKQESPAVEEIKPEEPTATLPVAPKSPKDDPAFLEAKTMVGKNARRQKKHEDPEDKKKEMTDASSLPEGEQRDQSSKEKQTENLKKAGKKGNRFNAASFKDKLRKKIQEQIPKNEDEAKAFPKSGKLDKAKDEFKSTVTEEKRGVTGPLEDTHNATQLPTGDISKTQKDIPPAKKADNPTAVPPELAIPKQRTDAEISLDHKSKELDDTLSRENITEQQLAESEEPKFEQALQKKQDAQREIAAAPGHYREKENEVLQKALKTSTNKTNAGLQGMVKKKNTSGKDVHLGQKDKESKTEKRQREIKETITGIYKKTEEDVGTILDTVSSIVQSEFEIMAMINNKIFNDTVYSRLDDHYGYFTFDDKIAEAVGLSDGVKHIFVEEKSAFIIRMNVVLDSIAHKVETGLNAALLRIEFGLSELDRFKKTLTTEELEFAQDLFTEAEDNFKDLETSIEEKQDELVDSLAEQYNENLNKLQEDFDKINDDLGSSWIADALSFIGDVVEAIRKLGSLLMSIIDRISNIVGDILAAPKRFFNHLISGLKGGMDEFTTNIDVYMEKGFWMWLTGASGKRSITVPAKMDGEGMFNLGTQVIGLDKGFILERIRIKLGKSALDLINKAEAVGDKLIEPVRILLDKGLGGLWKWVKDEISNKISEIFDKIKTEIFKAIIKKALLWVASLFIPGLGFIRLIQGIYKALKWLVDNIDRIIEIVNSFLDSLALAVAGNVGGIIKKVVHGLTLGVVVALDFLAKLVGLGNFADKLQKLLQSIRKPIEKAIDFLLMKAKPSFRKIQAAIRKAERLAKKGKEAAVKKGKQAAQAILKFFGIKTNFNAGGESHALYFKGTQKNITLIMESSPKDIEDFLDFYETEYKISKDPHLSLLATNIRSFLTEYEEPYKKLKKLEETDPKAKTIFEELLAKNLILSGMLKELMDGNRKVGKLDEKYALEGLTGTYKSMPRATGDKLTPDHQPQASTFKYAAELKSGRKRLYKDDSEMVKRASGSHADHAYAINLHEVRHMKGRTYGQTPAEFKTSADEIAASDDTEQVKRNKILTKLKGELKADVKAMKDVADGNYWDDLEGFSMNKTQKADLKKKIKAKIIHGCNELANQPMDDLKNE